MKRIFASVLAISAVLLCLSGCSREKEQRHIPSVYSGDITCTYTVEALSEPAMDYTLSFTRKDSSDTVKVTSPASIEGIEATVKQGSTAVTYGDRYIETLLPAFWGASPIDAMSAILNSLRDSTPQRRDEDRECITLEYSDKISEGAVRQTVILSKETLALQRAEVEVQGELLLKITCMSFQIY